MMKKFSQLNIFILALFLCGNLTAQQVSIDGQVIDSENSQPLYFANIRVLGTSYGTTSNRNGEFELKLNPGKYRLSASFLGYFSDTLDITVSRNINSILFKLAPARIFYPEIVIKPGENPAIPIIRKAIKRKDERNRLINNFEFEAYTKGIIKTTEDIKTGRNSIGISAGINDTAELFISGIMENQSKGFFMQPNSYKEMIIARKQSSNIPSSINILTGGRIIQNFYEDNISFFSREIPGPLAANALKYYYYYIESKTNIDNRVVTRIHIAPDNNTDPGFVGSIYIADSTYDLIGVDLMLNRAANTGGLMDSISLKQQFTEYAGNIYMPTNYSIAVKLNILGLAKLGFELTTILYDYNINKGIDPAIFNKAVITVLPDADKKDSLYWDTIQNIPNSDEEQTAYKRIDSVENVPLTFADRFSFLSSKIFFTDNFAVSAPLSMYHFNRVEGNSLDFGFYLNDALEDRLSSSIDLSYGFADKKFKKALTAEYLLGDYRTTSLSFTAYDRLNTLFGESEKYNDLSTTLLALISKDEFRNYYYSRGFEFNASAEVFPVLKLKGGVFNRTDLSASKNTEFSLFARNRTYRINPPVDDFRDMWGFKAGFELDCRNYIEDGFFRRRINENGKYFILSGGLTALLKPASSVSFSGNSLKYNAGLSAGLRTFRSADLSIRLEASATEDRIPWQMLYALPGNINLAGKNFTFRTLNVNEVIAQKAVMLFAEHNFKDEIFKLLRVPGLKDSELQLYVYFNSALCSINNSLYNSISGAPLQSFSKTPFMEAGFGLGHLLFPIQIEFSWKLNYRYGNNFRIGLNTAVL